MGNFIKKEHDLSLQLNDLKNFLIERKDRNVTNPASDQYVVAGTTDTGGGLGGENEYKVLGRAIIDTSILTAAIPAPNTLPQSMEENNNLPIACLSYRSTKGWEYLWHYALNELNLPNGNVKMGTENGDMYKIVNLAPGVDLTDAVNVSQLESATFGLLPQDPVIATYNDPADLINEILISSGSRFLIGDEPVGDWIGKTGQIATKVIVSEGPPIVYGWTYEEPAAGWLLLNHEYDPPTSQLSENENPCMMAYNAETGVEEWKIIYTGLIYSSGDGINITSGHISVKYDDNSITTRRSGTQNCGEVAGDNEGYLKILLPDDGVLSCTSADGGLVLNYDSKTLTKYKLEGGDKWLLQAKADGIVEAGDGVVGYIDGNGKITIDVVAADASLLVNDDNMNVQFGDSNKSLKLSTDISYPGVVVKVDNETIGINSKGLYAINSYESFDSIVYTHTAGLTESYETIQHGLTSKNVKATVYRLNLQGENDEEIYPLVKIIDEDNIKIWIKDLIDTFDFKVLVEKIK